MGRALSCPSCSVIPLPVSPSPRLPDPRIAALLAEAERRWGRGALVRWGDTVDPAEVETIPTGFTDLDEALGVGGLPCGRISEVFGPDSSGKQALVASLAVQCQKVEGVVAWIDPARRLDLEQMRVQGVELGSLLVARPENELQALEMAVRLARSGSVKLLVFDLAGSYQLSAISYQLSANRTRNSEPRSVLSAQSSSLSLALRRLVAAVDRNRIAFVFVSPAGAGSYYTHHSAGGQALRYFASMRLEMERREWIRRGREVVGCRSAVRVVKNKLAPPLREAEAELQFYRFPPESPAPAARGPGRARSAGNEEAAG